MIAVRKGLAKTKPFPLLFEIFCAFLHFFDISGQFALINNPIDDFLIDFLHFFGGSNQKAFVTDVVDLAWNAF
jgi:hypothetical protein